MFGLGLRDGTVLSFGTSTIGRAPELVQLDDSAVHCVKAIVLLRKADTSFGHSVNREESRDGDQDGQD